jgi:hypothetical protein
MDVADEKIMTAKRLSRSFYSVYFLLGDLASYSEGFSSTTVLAYRTLLLQVEVCFFR